MILDPSEPTTAGPTGPGDPFASQAAAVYRYLMARTGDPLRAGELTLAALERAVMDPEDPTGLFGAAVYTLAFPPHPLSGKRAGKPPEQEEPEGRQQPEVAVSGLANALAKLPEIQANAVALTCFGGVPAGRLAGTLGVSPQAAINHYRSGLSRLAALSSSEPHANLSAEELEEVEASLRELALQLPIPNGLASEARAIAGRRERPTGQGWGWRRWSWPFRFRVRRAGRKAVRLSPILVLLALALVGLRVYRPQAALSRPTPAPAQVSYVGNTSAAVGLLVPPGPDVCRDWAARFAQALGVSPSQVTGATDKPVPYSDPTLPSEDTGGSGMGCLIEKTGSGSDWPPINMGDGLIASVLSDQGFSLGETFRCGTCGPGNSMFGEYWNGQGSTWKKGDLRAMVSMAWRPTDHATCPAVDLCVPPPATQRTALRLWLARNSAQAVLDDFFGAWVNGSPAALDWATPTLRKLAPDLGTLDRLAGFQRSPMEVFQLAWRMTANTGTRLQLTAWGKLVNGLALPSREVAPFQLEFVAHPDGSWKLDQVGTYLSPPPNGDLIFWAGLDGTVFVHSLADGLTQMLAGPGTYKPSFGPLDLTDAAIPQLSPDGRWLALVQPDNGPQQQGTWLFDLEALGARRRLGKSYQLAWSPDGKRAALFAMDDPKQLLVWEAPFDRPPALLAAFSEALSSLAWSPDGRLIAALARLPDSTDATPNGQPMQQRRMVLVEGDTGKTAPLAVVRGYRFIPAAQDLAWTPDGKEVWVRSQETGVLAADGTRFRLFSPALDTDQAGLADSLMHPMRPINPSIVLVSPDRKFVAAGLTNQQAQNTQYLSVKPAGDPARSLWAGSQYPVGQMAWTGDSQSLVTGSPPDRLGEINLWAAATGEHEKLAGSVYWIGASSDLRRKGYMLAPQGKMVAVPKTPQPGAWTASCQQLQADQLCVQVPSGWQMDPAPDGVQNPLGIHNFTVDPPEGWVRLAEGDVLVQVYALPFSMIGTDNTLEQFFTEDQRGKAWEEVDLDGRKVISPIVPGSSAGTGKLYLFEQGNRLIEGVVYAPGDPTNAQAVEILASIQVTPGEAAPTPTAAP